MSTQDFVSLVEGDQRHLLLSVDKDTGKQNTASIIAYGSDPENSKKTLIFVSPEPWVFQELSLNISFVIFKGLMATTKHLSITNIGQEGVVIDRQSELGQFIDDFKNQVLANTQSHGPSQ